MPAVHLLGGLGSGHSCFPIHKNIQGSNDVYVNNTPVHRQGDLWQPHTCGPDTHTGVLAKGSSTVYVNGKQLGRIGDPVSCGSITIDGSLNVFCGG